MSNQEAADKEIKNFMKGLRQRNPHEPEFHQAVEEVVESVMPYVLDHENIRQARILERLTEPDRIVIFPRVVGRRRRQRPRRTAPGGCSSTTPSALTRAACASTRR